MWGSPPCFERKTLDSEIIENRKITVFTKDFWNYTSAEMFLSSSGRYLSPMWFRA